MKLKFNRVDFLRSRCAIIRGLKQNSKFKGVVKEIKYVDQKSQTFYSHHSLQFFENHKAYKH